MEYNRDVRRRKHIVKLPVYFQNHLPLLRDNGLGGGGVIESLFLPPSSFHALESGHRP
jgi:hypothetical protein